MADLRTEMADLRTEVRTETASLRTEMADFWTTVERSLRTSLMWTVSTMVASVGAVAAVVSLAG
jgi:hypothetical protein